MKIALIPFALILLQACAALESVTRHELHSGYFTLKNEDNEAKRIYADVHNDSVKIYDLKNDVPLMESERGGAISSFVPGSFLYNSTLVKKSIDVDLSTIVTKYRPAEKTFPPQLNANLNAAIYSGFRKDFFKFRTKSTITGRKTPSIRHLGYDAGVFAGIGITAVNPWVTNDNIAIEYDGVVFQKGVAFFLSSGNFSAGIACGFDNLIDQNSKFWIYNNRPWIGLMVGIANF